MKKPSAIFTSLHARFREIFRSSFVRYLATGIFNTGITYAAFVALVYVGINYLVANAACWILGICVSYLLTTRYVFQAGSSPKTFAGFCLSNLGSFLSSSALLFFLVDIIGLTPYVASLLTIPFIALINYLSLKLLVFPDSR